ncbi:hypothetical protein MIMGU_mgv1a025618mg, partial [Erythranthe guttata]
MGGKCPHRKVKKRRYSHKSARRTKFELMDILFYFSEYISLLILFFTRMILKKLDGESKSLPVDEDLPGMGQFYCLHCDRYFANVEVRDEHFKTKKHRR